MNIAHPPRPLRFPSALLILCSALDVTYFVHAA
jgi:hypothetical protein